MKKIIIITLLVIISSSLKVQSQPVVTDTLQWLKTNIEQRSSYFHGKPMVVLLDSLYGLKASLKDYTGAPPSAISRPDTVYMNHIIIYFDHIYSGAICSSHLDNPYLNTHVPYLYIKFKQLIPFIARWHFDNREGSGSITWNPSLAAYYGVFIVDSVTVGEY